MAKRQKFNVTVVWEAVAEFTVMARDQVDAERIVGMRGLPWRKAVEGDSDRYQLIVEPADDVESAEVLTAPPNGRIVIQAQRQVAPRIVARSIP